MYACISGGDPNNSRTFSHKWQRIFDLNTKQDPSRAGVDPVAPFEGLTLHVCVHVYMYICVA